MFNRFYEFHKTKNHFNHYFNIFTFFNTFFCHKYTLESHNISWKKEFSLRLNSLCYNLPYYAKSLEKYAPILPWLKFKHGHPLKTI